MPPKKVRILLLLLLSFFLSIFQTLTLYIPLSLSLVIAAAKELGTAVVAYAPLGRGYLTGTIKREDIKPGDFRNYAPRFQEEVCTTFSHPSSTELSDHRIIWKAFEKNKGIIDAVTALAQKKGVSNAQLCIAWVASLGASPFTFPPFSLIADSYLFYFQ